MTKRRNTTVKSERRAAKPVSAPPASNLGKEAGGNTADNMLHQLAEELGRLVARRLGERRKGYGLLEMLAGALIIALATLLFYRAMHR